MWSMGFFVNLSQCHSPPVPLFRGFCPPLRLVCLHLTQGKGTITFFNPIPTLLLPLTRLSARWTPKGWESGLTLVSLSGQHEAAGTFSLKSHSGPLEKEEFAAAL